MITITKYLLVKGFRVLVIETITKLNQKYFLNPKTNYN